MENLKAIIVFLLFWSIAIWCVRVVKRKHKKQIMKFSEELPEMELVTDEEERKYIYQSINGSGKFLTVLIVFVFLFNLWIMADEMKIIWKQWMNGLELDFWTFSGFGIMDWVIAEYLSTKIERKRICESGVIRKKIVHIKSYRDFGYGSTEGGLLAAAGISAAGIAIAAVTVGVMWAADVVYGYAQEAKGKESKRVTEAISDWVLDTAKQ